MSEAPGAAMTAGAVTAENNKPSNTEREAEERGRLKRRRLSSASPRRASSPSRGHERHSGSRYREHHRKPHRPCSPASSISPPTVLQKKTRRRSDAEADHTFRGRARNRSDSRGRTEDTVVEDESTFLERLRRFRKRSQPPRRHKIEEEDEAAELRRERSYHKLSRVHRRDSKGEGVEQTCIAEDRRTEQAV
ncbi:hypothetical protein EK21DRAFT_107197 [Setomelanomma holmii]|uniref:Uncharacterized protein n=1 Tax=Setomelanomma holmii TaxID=210430 RepID=A0A9P4LTU5_9PLEO|nr:hypothetical protein EK21DRAFT_107197 [Setomelanomma holmii]